MGHYASFYEKSSLLLVTTYARPIHANDVIPATIVSVIEDYYVTEIKDMIFYTPIIPKKGLQKSSRKKLRTEVNLPHL